MYYPKSQIITNLYTNGNEFIVISTGENYKGFYYKTSDGKIFSNKSPNDIPTYQLTTSNKSSIVGVAESTESEFKSTSYYQIKPGDIFPSVSYVPNAPSPPQLISPAPTQEDYELGEFVRYFAYKGSTYETIEINKLQFDYLQNKNPNIQYQLWEPVSINWLLTGDFKKTSQANFNTVKLVENRQKLPYFSKYFRGKYDKYFKYSDNENLYSDGSELVYSKNRKPYIGYYHIHPEKGPMVGRQHIEEPHEYLAFLPTGSTPNPLPPFRQSGSYVENPPTFFRTGGGY